MRKVREICPISPDLARECYRLGNAEVGRVRCRKQRVQNHELHAAQRVQRFFRERLGIRHVAKIADSETQDRHRPVIYLERQNVQIADFQRLARMDRTRNRLRFAGSRKRQHRVKNVRKPRDESGQRLRGSIDRGALAPPGEGTNVIQTVDVIRMIVSQKHSIRGPDPRAEKLQPQLRRRINEKARSPVALEERAYPGSFVPWITGSANFAIASDLRNSETCAGSEESELQGEGPDAVTTAVR